MMSGICFDLTQEQGAGQGDPGVGGGRTGQGVIVVGVG